MAITFVAVDSNSANSTVIPCDAADLTVSVDDFIWLVCSVNQAGTSGDRVSSFSKASGTATIGTITTVHNQNGTETQLQTGWCRVTGAGTLRMQANLTVSKKACASVLALSGVDTGATPIGNTNIGTGTGTAANSGTAAPAAAGDWLIGSGAWTANPTGTPSTSPGTWTEQVDVTSTGGAASTRSSLYLETWETTTTTAYASTPTLSASQTWRQGVAVLKRALTVTVTPALGVLTLAGLVPTVTASANQLVTAGLAALSLAGFAPTATTSDNITVTPALGAITVTGFVPTVTASGGIQVIYYANAASSGGDGTTNATSGANAAFAQVSTALSTIRANYVNDFVTADKQPTLKLEGTGAFGQVTENTAVTTDATHYLEIVCEGAHRHAGVWSNSLPRITAAVGVSTVRLLQYKYLRLRGLQIENTATGASTSVGGLNVGVPGTLLDIRVEECIIRATTAPTSFAAGIAANAGASGSYKFANNIIYGFSVGTTGSGISCGSAGPSHYLYSNTIAGCYTGVTRTNSAGTGRLKDNIFSAIGAGTPVANGANWTSMDYCSTNDASFGTGVPSGTGNRTSQTFTFVSGSDYHLASGDAGAKGYGTDLSADTDFAITKDIDGVTRSGTWDIGADQTVATGTTVTPALGALTLAGFAPTATTSNNITVTPALGALTLTGVAPSALAPVTVQAGVGALAVAGLAPTATTSANVAVTPALGVLTLAGLAPTATATAHVTASPALGVLDLTGFAPAAATPTTVTPNAGALALAGLAPAVALTDNQSASPATGVLALAGLAPAVALTDNQSVTPGAGALALAGLAPSVALPVAVQPDVGEITLTGLAPAAVTTANVAATPALGTLTLAGFAPAIATPVVVQTDVGALDLVGLAPSIALPGAFTPEPGVLVLAGLAPAVTASDHQSVTPAVGDLTLAGLAPIAGASVTVTPAAGALTIAGLAPAASTSANTTAAPGVGVLALAGLTPTATTSDQVLARPGLGALTVDGMAPTVGATAHVLVTPAVGALLATGLAPSATASDSQAITPGTGAALLSGLAPVAYSGAPATAPLLPVSVAVRSGVLRVAVRSSTYKLRILS